MVCFALIVDLLMRNILELKAEHHAKHPPMHHYLAAHPQYRAIQQAFDRLTAQEQAQFTQLLHKAAMQPANHQIQGQVNSYLQHLLAEEFDEFTTANVDEFTEFEDARKVSEDDFEEFQVVVAKVENGHPITSEPVVEPSINGLKATTSDLPSLLDVQDQNRPNNHQLPNQFQHQAIETMDPPFPLPNLTENTAVNPGQYLPVNPAVNLSVNPLVTPPLNIPVNPVVNPAVQTPAIAAAKRYGAFEEMEEEDFEEFIDATQQQPNPDHIQDFKAHQPIEDNHSVIQHQDHQHNIQQFLAPQPPIQANLSSIQQFVAQETPTQDHLATIQQFVAQQPPQNHLSQQFVSNQQPFKIDGQPVFEQEVANPPQPNLPTQQEHTIDNSRPLVHLQVDQEEFEEFQGPPINHQIIQNQEQPDANPTGVVVQDSPNDEQFEEFQGPAVVPNQQVEIPSKKYGYFDELIVEAPIESVIEEAPWQQPSQPIVAEEFVQVVPQEQLKQPVLPDPIEICLKPESAPNLLDLGKPPTEDPNPIVEEPQPVSQIQSSPKAENVPDLSTSKTKNYDFFDEIELLSQTPIITMQPQETNLLDDTEDQPHQESIFNQQSITNLQNLSPQDYIPQVDSSPLEIHNTPLQQDFPLHPHHHGMHQTDFVAEADDDFDDFTVAPEEPAPSLKTLDVVRVQPQGTWRDDICKVIGLEGTGPAQMIEELELLGLNLYVQTVQQYQKVTERLMELRQRKQDALAREEYEVLVQLRDELRDLEVSARTIKPMLLQIQDVADAFQGRTLSQVVEEFTGNQQPESAADKLMMYHHTRPAGYAKFLKGLQQEMLVIKGHLEELQCNYPGQIAKALKSDRLKVFLQGAKVLATLAVRCGLDITIIENHLKGLGISLEQATVSRALVEQVLIPFVVKQPIRFPVCSLTGLLVTESLLVKDDQQFDEHAYYFYQRL